MTLNHDEIDGWTADADDAPVALHYRETMMPAEGHGAPVFPATYAGSGDSPGGYNIDELADGTKVATLDSVGSQANRMEPVFKQERNAGLVPKIEIVHGNKARLSLLDAGHRLGDAIVRGTELAGEVREAFETFNRSGSAQALAEIGPTSLVFGVWDSRGVQSKLPRIVQSTVRAWDVSPLTRSAQYFPPIDYVGEKVFTETDKKEAEDKPKSRLAKRGYVAVPSVRTHGGVVVHGEIRRDVTVNLVAVRRLRSDAGEESDLALRRYILGLSLVAATAPQDGFLRAGCLLVQDPATPPTMEIVRRDGSRRPLSMNHDAARAYAERAATAFGVGKPRAVEFDKKLAVADSEAKAG